MANIEQIFNSCNLNLITPSGVVNPPDVTDDIHADHWLKELKALGERQQVFYGELGLTCNGLKINL